MKACLKRTGGVAGILKQWDISESALSVKNVSGLKSLLEKASFFSLPSEIKSPKKVRDSFFYELTIEDKGRKHRVRRCEPISKSLCDCLQWIKAHAKNGQ